MWFNLFSFYTLYSVFIPNQIILRNDKSKTRLWVSLLNQADLFFFFPIFQIMNSYKYKYDNLTNVTYLMFHIYLWNKKL